MNETRPRGVAVPNHNADSVRKSEKEDSEWLEICKALCLSGCD